MRATSAIAAIVLAVSTAAACSSSGGRGHPIGGASSPQGQTTVLVCQRQPDAFGDLVDDEAAIIGRIRSFRGAVSSARTRGDRLIVAMTGVPRAQARTLCDRGVFEVRGLVTATRRSSCAGPACGRTRPADLSTTEAAFNKLPAARKAVVTRALTNANCAEPHPNPKSPALIACNPLRRAFLLGPTIASGVDVVAATPVGPSQGSTQWGVLVTLDAAGADALSGYTRQNNVRGTPPTGSPDSCGRNPIGTPCADFIAFVVDGVVLSAPVTLAPITGGSVQIVGNFTQDTATLLAAELAQGALPVPLEFRSLR